MHKLVKLQQSFYRNIFKQDDDLGFISSNFPEERFDIYRQTIFENMRNALSVTFPGVWKLLGENCANSSAYVFCMLENNHPISGCLDDWGGAFPDFLGQELSFQKLPYLRDYAYYEWIKHKSYNAEQVSVTKLSDFKNVSEELIDFVGVSFLPSVFTFTSNFFLKQIEEIVEDLTAKAINLSLFKSYILIVRPEDEVLTFWIDEDLWFFIRFLEVGLTISEAYHKTQKQHVHFDLTKAIQFLLENNIVSKINLKKDNYNG